MQKKAPQGSSRLALLAKAKSGARLRLNQLPPGKAQRRAGCFSSKDWKLIRVPAWPAARGLSHTS